MHLRLLEQLQRAAVEGDVLGLLTVIGYGTVAVNRPRKTPRRESSVEPERRRR